MLCNTSVEDCLPEVRRVETSGEYRHRDSLRLGQLVERQDSDIIVGEVAVRGAVRWADRCWGKGASVLWLGMLHSLFAADFTCDEPEKEW